MGTDTSIAPQDEADTALTTVLPLVVVAAIEAALLPPSDTFPQLANQCHRVARRHPLLVPNPR